MRALRAHAEKHTKQGRHAGAASATQARDIFRLQQPAANDAVASSCWTHIMLFLDLYGVPAAQPDAPRPRLFQALGSLAETVSAWNRRMSDRRILSRMTIRQLEDLQLSWPDDFRNIKAHS
jgi:uncharacterized protein YjiS (DUF1127 family)